MSKNLNTVQKIAKAGRIISKIIFIFSIIGAVASFIGVSALWGLHKVELDGVEVVNIIEEAGKALANYIAAIQFDKSLEDEEKEYRLMEENREW